MIQLVLDPASVTQSTEYVAEVRAKILAAIRDGMMEAMRGLAAMAEAQSVAAGIKEHSGDLLANIESSPKVTENYALIRGTVSSDVGVKHIGLWLEEGTHVPAVANGLYEFTEPDGESFYTRGHRAFDVKPHPFLNPALKEYETTITSIIQAAVEEAIAA